MALHIVLKSQDGFSSDPARMRVFDGDTLCVVVEGVIEHHQGADGRFYPCVILTQVKPKKPKHLLDTIQLGKAQRRRKKSRAAARGG